MLGELVIDRFRVLERIGSGGMGTVYRALDERLQRHVAVKEIAGAGADRVLREAQAAARLNHPGIVTLYELGSAGGSALLVSELVEGETLAELAESGNLSDRDVAELGADVCDALAHAHARGVIHRDVKPQNVIVRDDADAGPARRGARAPARPGPGRRARRPRGRGAGGGPRLAAGRRPAARAPRPARRAAPPGAPRGPAGGPRVPGDTGRRVTITPFAHW